MSAQSRDIAAVQPSLLLLGESWFVYSVHQKGFDTFQTATYEEGCGPFVTALRSAGWVVDHIPSHLIDQRMPATVATLARYSVVVLSDVGSNTFNLGKTTFQDAQPTTDRLALLKSYVAGGGGLLMVGGYLSFSGIDGKAGFAHTCLADVLPVAMETGDDRNERPCGVIPKVTQVSHPILQAVPSPWPSVLGYNRLRARAGASVLVECDNYPLLIVGHYAHGRVAAYASDLGPHWCSRDFMSWPGYGALWAGVMGWLCAQATAKPSPLQVGGDHHRTGRDRTEDAPPAEPVVG